MTRLATFNILHGRSVDDGLVDNDRMAADCALLAADVLCLQEVDRGQLRSHGADQTAAVAKASGSPWWRFEPALMGEPGGEWRAATDSDSTDRADSTDAGGDIDRTEGNGSADLTAAESASAPAGPTSNDSDSARGSAPAGPSGPSEGAAYGVAIVSRLEVRRWHVVRLAAAPVRSPVVVPGGRGRFILLPDEPRVVLAAEVITPDGPLLVATTHLSFVPGWNLRQVRRATSALAGIAGGLPCVLLGDLNFPGRLPALATGWKRLGGTVRTYPAGRPRMQIDHALGQGPVRALGPAQAVHLGRSDHQALVVDVEVGDA